MIFISPDNCILLFFSILTRRTFNLTIIIICRRQSECCQIIPETKLRDYSTIFTEPEENNNYSCYCICLYILYILYILYMIFYYYYCFSIIPQVIIREIAFSFILFVSSSKTSRNRVRGGQFEN